MSNRRKLSPPPHPSPTVTRSPIWQRPAVWIAALVVVAGAIALLVAAGNDADSGDRPAETAFAELIGTPLAPFAQPDPGIGQPVPDLSAQTLTGERVRVGGDDTARIYAFFAHWCPHCQADLPRTTAWLENNQLPEGVEIIAVSTAVNRTGDNYPPSEWFEREGWPEPVLLDDDDGTLATGMGLTGFPYWVAADRDGTVVARVAGELDDSGLEALISAVS